MNKHLKFSFVKTVFTLIILVLTQVATFAAQPEVYNSQANLSNLSLSEVSSSTWVWIMILCVAAIGTFAILAGIEPDHHDAAH